MSTETFVIRLSGSNFHSKWMKFEGMLLINISTVDLVAAGHVKLKKIMKMGIHSQTKLNLHYREKLHTSHKFIINL